MSERTVAVKVKGLKKNYIVGEQDVEVLRGMDFEIYSDDFAVIFGPSGCGKSTLLNIILGLEVPSSGEILVLDEPIYKDTDEDMRSKFRKKHVGMVYQQANWIKSLDIQENVAFPLMLQGIEKAEAIIRANEILSKVSMKEWASYHPLELSSGQQQRVSLARALITNPSIIVADEPTGNLDFQSGQDMMQLLADFNKQGKLIVMVTHDLEYLKYSTRLLKMFDGRLVGTFTGNEIKVIVSGADSKRGAAVDSNIDSTDGSEFEVDMAGVSIAAIETFGALKDKVETNKKLNEGAAYAQVNKQA